ncbi:polysaccharide deacetylase family protein [Ferruginibacter sp. SUN106]|uniref:polysaccharide deacetylase family protein n=1 Tax=Ferruginibacter sp. SUN106 TaxID=2978348 RepID=UPI003D359BD7
MDTINNDKGLFIISLDFELFWGVWDVTTREKYGDNILGVKDVIPRLISLFDLYNFKATFATVGFLFAKNKKELLAALPGNKPAYSNDNYNVYSREIPAVGNDEVDDPYHFGYSLFQQLQQTGHEISTHTFSHYYCLEEGQCAEEFEADIIAAKNIATANGITLYSIVFPRNQVNEEYLTVLKDNGIAVYRGNPTSWIYKPRKFTAEVPFIRLCRLLDTYFPISGYNTHIIKKEEGLPVNVPASRFLKPYNKNLAWLEKMKLNRIMNEMTRAAKENEAYHLWWHPHNFGVNITENMANLTIILDHFQTLQKKYGFANCTMKEAAGL